MGGILLGYPANPIIPNGAGFSGATIQPATQGNIGDTGYTENAIARFNVVPYQTFTGTLNIGIVAFSISKIHANGIKAVEFIANGGNSVFVFTPTLNSQTNTIEFWAKLRASDFPDGQIEIRAIIYPNAGIPRILGPANPTASLVVASLFVNANSGGTLPTHTIYISNAGNDSTGNGTSGNPYATISKAMSQLMTLQSSDVGGGIINLMSGGSFAYSGATENFDRPASIQWMTIQTNPGDSAGIISTQTTGIGTRCAKVRLKSLTVNGPNTITSISTVGGVAPAVWFDTVTYIGPGRLVLNSQPTTGWNGGMYHTDGTYSASQNATLSCQIVRNVTVNNIGSDAFSNSILVVNSSVSNIDSSGSSPAFHPDCYQMTTVATNNIVYGVTATTNNTAQCLFSDQNTSVLDVAIINYIAVSAGSVFDVMQFGGPTQNLYLWNTSLTGGLGAFWRTDLNFVGTDVVLDTCTFDPANPSPNPQSGVTIR